MDALTRTFWDEGLFIMKHKSFNSSLTGNRRFRSFFGVSPNVCSVTWKLIKNKPQSAQPKHILWCLLFLKAYNKEHVNASIVEADEKTFREWTWKFVELLAGLHVVKWERRVINSKYRNMHVSLDGTDYRTREPQPFNKKWFGHKFNAAGIRYELGLSIGNGDIVWASGGFPCGEWNDIKIAKNLYLHYACNEVTLADGGYNYKKYFKQPSNRMEKIILARHETLNGRLKQFEILNGRFRHSPKKHPIVFHAIVNLVQISIDCGEKLFDL